MVEGVSLCEEGVVGDEGGTGLPDEAEEPLSNPSDIYKRLVDQLFLSSDTL